MRRVTLFSNRYFALQLVEEVHQEDNVALGLLGSLGLGGGHQRHDAFAVRREIEVLETDGALDLPVGSQPRFIGHEGIVLHRISRHHDVVVQSLEKKLVSVARPHRVPTVADLAHAALDTVFVCLPYGQLLLNKARSLGDSTRCRYIDSGRHIDSRLALPACSQ